MRLVPGHSQFIRRSALGALCGLALAGDGRASEHLVANWQSSNRSVDVLPFAIRDFVLNLYNSGRLPTADVEVLAKPAPAATIFQQEFPYLEWTHDVSSMLCDMNPSGCTRPLEGVADAGQMVQSLPNTRGFAITPHDEIDWRLTPSAGSLKDPEATYSLTVPEIGFRQTVNWVPFRVEPGSLRRVYEGQALGCAGLIDAGSRFAPGDDYLSRIEDISRANENTCAAEVFFENYPAIRYELARSLGTVGTRTKAEAGKAPLDAADQLTDLEASLEKSPDPWRTLDRFLSGVYGGKGYVLQLPVFALEATVALPDQIDTAASSDIWVQGVQGVTSTEDTIRTLQAPGLFIQAPISGNGVTWRADGAFEDISALLYHEAGADPAAYPLIQTQMDKVFDFIGYPWKGGIDINGNVQRLIVFLDQGFQDGMKHCVFGQISDHPCEHPARVRKAEDFEILPPDDLNVKAFALHEQSPERTHGHAVASVASSNWESGGMLGLDPLALPVPFKLEWNQVTDALGIGSFQGRLDALKTDLRGRRLFDRRVYWDSVVWNVSGHMTPPGNKQPIEGLAQYIGKTRADATNFGQLEYYVFAAGNVTDLEFEQMRVGKSGASCGIYPACLTKEEPGYGTMITVVGAEIDDGQPRLWKDNGFVSFANPAFQIAAIARDVPVSLANADGAFVLENGTSFAAPQVAAAVSNLLAASVSDPSVVVGRLMACGRMSKALEPFVAGGLLDFDCTLETDKAQLAFEKDWKGVARPEYARLRTGQLKQVWSADLEPNHDIPMERGKLATVARTFSPVADSDRPSIVGFRTFSDDPKRINVVAWGQRAVDGDQFERSHAPLVIDNRERIDSNVILEFRFDAPDGGDPETVCVRLSDVTQYIAAIEESTEDFHDLSEPQCD